MCNRSDLPGSAMVLAMLVSILAIVAVISIAAVLVMP